MASGGSGYEKGEAFLGSFFNGPDMPAHEIGGWYIRGHDAAGNYAEFVVAGNAPNVMSTKILPRIEGWVEFVRTPLAIGSPLLTDISE